VHPQNGSECLTSTGTLRLASKKLQLRDGNLPMFQRLWDIVAAYKSARTTIGIVDCWHRRDYQQRPHYILQAE
jgi:hypothetical protein